MSSVGADQLELLGILRRNGVELVVVGGIAAQVHGWTGATTDLDVAVSITDDNVIRLNQALQAAGGGPPLVGALGTVFETRLGRLEIVRRADGIGEYADWLGNARQEDLGGALTVVVAAPADILRSKQAAGRSKDLAALPQMRRDFVDAGSVDEADAGEPIAASKAVPAPSAVPRGLAELLGPRPDERPGRWEIAAQAVLEYRERWKVAGPGLGGEPPAGSDQSSDRRRLEALIHRLRS